MTQQMDDLMLPLPEPECLGETEWDDIMGYTADQMREYAKKAVEAERVACAALVHANALACDPGSMLQTYLASNAVAIRARGNA